MASISTDPDGKRRILFVGADRKRRTIRLGKCSERDAEKVRGHIEDLLSCSINRTAMSRDNALWLAEIGDALHSRLARAKLVDPRHPATPANVRTLQSVIAEFKEKRQDAKQSTRDNWQQGFDSLVAIFGDDRDIASVGQGDADDWRQKQVAANLADATIRKRTRIINTLFNWAIRRQYVAVNPFRGLKSTSIQGREKPYVAAEDAQALIDELPGTPWKLFVALGRFAGLRVPSEALALRWQHVDWENGRITVPVPKLAHIAGKGERVIPIFKELRPLLLQAFEEAPVGETRVLALPDVTPAYLRKVVVAALQRTGVKPWACLFHALRASCETDLMQHFPAHVVAAWIGHDLRIAQKHYLQMLDRDFDAAARGPAHHDGSAAQNPTQYPHAQSRAGSRDRKRHDEKAAENKANANKRGGERNPAKCLSGPYRT